MSPFEVLLIVLLLVGVGLSARGKSNLGRMRETLAIPTLVFTGAHLFVEGYRWQMLPAYIVAVELAAVAALNAKAGPKVPRMVAATGRILAGVAVLVSGFLAWAFPVPDLPEPSGKYALGATTAYLKDETREEIYTDAIGDRREIMAQVWYPADPAPDAAPSAWVSNASVIGPAIARWVNLPSFLFDHINLVWSKSHVDAPIAANSPYPVLLYSHGWGGFRQINQNQLEQLASLGYVVVAVDHTYGAIVTEFPDGRIVANKRSILPPSGSPDFAPRFAELANVYSQDLRFTLNELARANIGDSRRLSGSHRRRRALRLRDDAILLAPGLGDQTQGPNSKCNRGWADRRLSERLFRALSARIALTPAHWREPALRRSRVREGQVTSPSSIPICETS